MSSVWSYNYKSLGLCWPTASKSLSWLSVKHQFTYLLTYLPRTLIMSHVRAGYSPYGTLLETITLTFLSRDISPVPFCHFLSGEYPFLPLSIQRLSPYFFCPFLSRDYPHTFLLLSMQRLSTYLFDTFYPKKLAPYLFVTFYPAISPVLFCYFLSRD